MSRSVRRARVRKSRSARKFRQHVSRTKAANVRGSYRGGIRL